MDITANNLEEVVGGFKFLSALGARTPAQQERFEKLAVELPRFNAQEKGQPNGKEAEVGG